MNEYKFVYYEIEISSLSSIIDYENEKNHIWQFGRVVKASDSKSDGVTRVGSNPAAVEFFYYC